MTSRRPRLLPAALALVVAVAVALAAHAMARGGKPPPPYGVGPAAVAARFGAGEGQALVGGMPVAVHPALDDVYASRRWAPAWATRPARRAAAGLLADAASDGLRPNELHTDDVARLTRRLAALDTLEGAAFEAARPRAEATLADLDLLVTDGLLRYADALLGRRVDAAELYPGVWFPARREAEPAALVARALASNDPAAAVADVLDGLRPPHAEYAALRQHLQRLRLAAQTWVAIPEGDPLLPDSADGRAPRLRHRLQTLGFLGATPGGAGPAPLVYDSTLAEAVRRFQASRGLLPDGVVDAATTAALNVHPERLIEVLALNLERWRWLPDDLGERHVLANLPAFWLRARERDRDHYRDALTMPTNIGNALTQGWTTPVLSDSIVTVAYQPTWYVPASLAAAEVFPLARADSSALTRRGFDVYQGGARVDPLQVKWDSVSVGAFRFVQRPGPANPLGRVKFVTTNPYAILIHDTPRRLFGSTASSGCIHAGNADGLAAYLLGAEDGWTEERARQAYRGGGPQGVKLTRPVRTHFVYFTAWPLDEGGVAFYGDVYGYDTPLARALGYRTEPLTASRTVQGSAG